MVRTVCASVCTEPLKDFQSVVIEVSVCVCACAHACVRSCMSLCMQLHWGQYECIGTHFVMAKPLCDNLSTLCALLQSCTLYITLYGGCTLFFHVVRVYLHMLEVLVVW